MNHRAAPGAAAAGSAAASTTLSTPSAPTPNRRSQSARTSSGVSSRSPSGSGTITKSFPVPCPLTNRTQQSYGAPPSAAGLHLIPHPTAERQLAGLVHPQRRAEDGTGGPVAAEVDEPGGEAGVVDPVGE